MGGSSLVGNACRMPLGAAERAGGDTAVIDGDVTVSCGALAARSLSFASTVTEAGVRPGDRVAVLLRRNADAAVAFFGTLAAGAVAVVVNDQLRPRQIEHILDHSGSSVLQSAAEMIDRLPRPLETKAVVIDADEVPATGSATPVPRVGGDVAEVVCNSRSTGLPKGVTFARQSLGGMHRVTSYVGICEHDRIASLLPFNFDMGGSPTR